MKTALRLASVWLTLQFFGASAEAAVYKCIDAAGKVTYQTVSCPDSSNATSVPVGTAATPAVRAPAPPPKASPGDAWGIAIGDGFAPAPDARPPRQPTAAADDDVARRPGVTAMPEPPRVRLSFELLSTDLRRLAWTNSGPKDGRRMDGSILGGSQAEGSFPPFALHETRQESYTITGNGGTLVWLPKGPDGPKQQISPPARLPALSWASSLAWDTGRNVLAVVSTGGVGYFYRYDTRSHTWLDARSMKDRDLVSLAFDAVNNRFVGITDAVELLTFNDQGDVQQIRPLAGRLPGLSAGASQAPGLLLVARGGAVAIVAIRRASVTHIWTYEPESDRIRLTYKSTVKSP